MLILQKASEIKSSLKLEYISIERIKEEIETPCNDWNKKTLRKVKNQLKKLDETIRQQKEQKQVKEMIINIEWKRSAMYGNNPILEAKIQYVDGSWSNTYGKKYTCSGCGYDKESTVIAQLFNDYLCYALWQKKEIISNNKGKDRSVVPYGVNNYSPDHYSFAGGIGTSCYYSISEFIGGKFEHISNGKTFDVYKFTARNVEV